MSISNKSDFCFILGRGRSGTSLLTSMLNTSPSVSVAPEALFIMNTYNKYKNKKWTRKNLHKFHQDLWLEARMLSWSLNRDELLIWLYDCEAEESFATVCMVVYARYAYEQGKQNHSLLVDKNPSNSLFVEKLVDIFPKAKFIILIRDYRDNVVSYQNVGFDCNDVAALSYRWKHYNEIVEKAAKKYPKRFLSLRYEDLVERTESVLEQICTFTGIDYCCSMLDFHHEGGDRDAKWHKNLNTPVNSQRVNQWKNELSKEQIRIAESICGSLGEQYGYQLSGYNHNAISWWEKKGLTVGYLMTWLEYILFRLPISIRSNILRFYRFFTGSHSLTGERVN
jgi:hypothetical protein